jgi:hypothetical protein
MPTGYVKSIVVNVENKDTPEILFKGTAKK